MGVWTFFSPTKARTPKAVEGTNPWRCPARKHTEKLLELYIEATEMSAATLSLLKYPQYGGARWSLCQSTSK